MCAKMKHKQPTEAIVLATEKDKESLIRNIPYIYQNTGVKTVYVIANTKNKDWIKKIHGAVFYDESQVITGLNIESVKSKIFQLTGSEKYAGWYLQQFLKMAWAYRATGENYLAIDADTSILNPVDYITDDGKYFLTIKVEYHKPYFDTVKKLFNEIERIEAGSFIAEQMIFDCRYMKELIERIEQNYSSSTKKFFEIILETINKEDICKGGFSEFETYGNYITQKYPDDVVLRKLRTFRQGSDILGANPSPNLIDWASKDFDIVSFENYEIVGKRVKMFRLFASIPFVQNCFRFKTIAKLYQKITKLSNSIGKKNTLIFDEIE